MSCGFCVENCSNNAKSQPIFVFFHLVSNGVGAGCKKLVGHHRLKFLNFWSFNWCKGGVLLQFCEKIQSSMHYIFTQIYLIVSIGQSHMESPTEFFMKKLFFQFWCDSHPHFTAFEPTYLPTKITPNRSVIFCHPLLSFKTSPGDPWTQSLKTNFLNINSPQYESNHFK